jgi:triosephosphate isomerase
MNLDLAAAVALARATAGIADETAGIVTTGIAVPFPFIPAVSDAVATSSLLVGAQDVSRYEPGAHTGDVAAGMIVPWCRFAIAGHSERRQDHGETDDMVREKIAALHAVGLTALVCVGETAIQREAGEAVAVVTTQVRSAVRDLDDRFADLLMVAYEPVWAIGTGVSAQPRDAEAMATVIRRELATAGPETGSRVPILYGGSVTADNASVYLDQPDIDGALVGGASLRAPDFAAIVRGTAALRT